MMCFTLDSNCLIDLEEGRSDAVVLEELKELWRSGQIDLAVVSVSASENQPTGTAMQNYGEFEEKLKRVGLDDARELPPVVYWDFGYWDHCLWASHESNRQISEIRGILFPASQHVPPDDPSQNSKWRNQTCDVLIAWAHGFHKADHLVTRDQNYHRTAQGLAHYGIQSIVAPKEALRIARGA